MKYSSLIILILLISCSGKNPNPKTSVTKFNKGWTDFHTKDSIPELLTLTLKKVLESDFKIANPTDRFNATDVINDSIPTRQLRLLSRKGDTWRIAYIQGGIGKHYVYAECKISNGTISNFKISQSLLKLESNDSIDKYLADKKLLLQKVKIGMENNDK